MPKLKKQRTTEETRRRKDVDDFLRAISGGVKELGGIWKERLLSPIKAADRVGGTLLGKDTGTTHGDIIEAVLGGMTAGTPGGLPTGAVGAGMTRSEALKTLGRSAVAMKRVGKKPVPANVRDIRHGMDKLPDEVFTPIQTVRYADNLPSNILGRNLRKMYKEVPGESGIVLAPQAKRNVLFHETGHSSSLDKAVKAHRTDTPTESQFFARKLEDATMNELKLNRADYTTPVSRTKLPVEQHARAVERRLVLHPSKRLTKEEYDEVFVDAARMVSGGMNKKPKKKLTPGERARAIQEAAEKGIPRYLRRKAD